MEKDILDRHILVLTKLYTGGAGRLATMVGMARPSLFATLGERRPLARRAARELAAILRVDKAGFVDDVAETWLARDDADIEAFEALPGARLDMLVQIKSTTQVRGGTGQQHYYLVRASLNGTSRHIVLRMNRGVSEKFSKRKIGSRTDIYVVDYRNISVLNAVSAQMGSDQSFVKFIEFAAAACDEQDAARAAHAHQEAQSFLELATQTGVDGGLGVKELDAAQQGVEPMVKNVAGMLKQCAKMLDADPDKSLPTILSLLAKTLVAETGLSRNGREAARVAFGEGMMPSSTEEDSAAECVQKMRDRELLALLAERLAVDIGVSRSGGDATRAAPGEALKPGL